jgi:tetratricopeptide (TPR) repeat protein/CHAT domain-containing protein
MRKVRSLLLAISLGILVGPVSALLAPSVSMGRDRQARPVQELKEALRLTEKAAQLDEQGRYAEAEPLLKRSLAIVEKTLGPNHPAVAEPLNALANLYYHQGRYKEAEPLFKRSLAIFEKKFGSNQIDVGTLLSNLANLYTSQGRYKDAEPMYKRSLAISEKTLGRNHFDVAATLNNLAGLYKSQGRYKDAEPLYKRSLAIYEKARSPTHPHVATVLSGLANLYRDQGLYGEAEPLFKRALAIREKALGPDHPDVADSLDDLARLYNSQGRYRDAEPLYKRSLAIREQALGPDNLEVAASLNNMAGPYQSQGRYKDAEALYKRSLAIDEKALGPDHPDVAISLNNLARLYYEQGLFSEAEPLYKRSLAIREKALGRDHRDVAESLNDLANFYVGQGRYDDAEPMFKRSLAVREKALGPDHPDVADSLSSLAALYHEVGHSAEAEPMCKRALAIREKALGPDHPTVAESLNNLALLYDDQGRYADAEPLLKRALAIYEKALDPTHPHVAESLNNLAVLYGGQGRYAEAEAVYKRSLAIYEKALGPQHPGVAMSLNNLAGFYDDQGRYAEALPIVRRTIERGFAANDPAFPVFMGSQRAGLIDASESFSNGYGVLQFTSSSAAAEAVKKLAQRFAAGSGELAELVRKEQDLEVEAAGLDKPLVTTVSKAPNERDETSEEEMHKRLGEIGTEREKLSDVLAERFPDYVALANPKPLTLQETQALLADDEAVIAFNIGNKKSYAWVVTKTAAEWTEIPTNEKTLGEEIKKLRQSLTFTEDEPFDAALSHTVYQQTFGPIAEKLAGKQRLSVFANGALTSIPFSILITSDPQGKKLKDDDWLIKSYALTILPSIYSLKTMRAQMAKGVEAKKPMIAFADPIFSKDTHDEAKVEQVAMRSLSSFYQGSELDLRSLAESLPPLPGTRTEVETIAKDLDVGTEDVKLGLNATEKAVKQSKLADYRIVYFATHGLVAGDLQAFTKAKAEPALVFTIPDKPTDVDDGLLQASEVAELKLNADWVVLSACNTASSDAVGAEPLSGLARAFIYAGGKSLVVSNWDVSDDATAKLMSNLFEISNDNPELSHGEMMRQATLNLLDAATTDEEAHPRVWAPFVVVGEPAKVR